MKIKNEQHPNILLRYQSGECAFQIGKSLNVSDECIFSILKKYNIKRRITRKYSYDINFFDEINNEEKAYWLGNLYGDGNVYKTTLELKLNGIDLGHIEKFKKAIKAEHPIEYVRSNNSYRIRITDKDLPSKLKLVGIFPKKAWYIKYPNLPKELDRHFVRGFFDADGWIINYTRKDGRIDRQTCFSSNSWIFLHSIWNKIIENTLIKRGSLIRRKNQGCQLTFGGNKSAFRVASWMYENATIWLDRKKAIYQQWLKSRNQ